MAGMLGLKRRMDAEDVVVSSDLVLSMSWPSEDSRLSGSGGDSVSSIGSLYCGGGRITEDLGCSNIAVPGCPSGGLVVHRCSLRHYQISC